MPHGEGDTGSAMLVALHAHMARLERVMWCQSLVLLGIVLAALVLQLYDLAVVTAGNTDPARPWRARAVLARPRAHRRPRSGDDGQGCWA